MFPRKYFKGMCNPSLKKKEKDSVNLAFFFDYKYFVKDQEFYGELQTTSKLCVRIFFIR